MKDNYLRSTKYQDRSQMIQDGWVVSKEGGEDLLKWVISNEKYSYRRYFYALPNDRAGYQDGFAYIRLLNNLAIDVQLGKISLPYEVPLGSNTI